MNVPLPNVDESDRLPLTVPVLKAALREHYGKKRTGIHVSDVTGCIRKKIFEEICPSEKTDSDLNNFSSGRGIDGALEDLTYIKREKFRAKPELWVSIETAEPIFWYDAGPNDICAHPDIWDMELGIPIEGKSNKTENIWMDKFNTMTSPPPVSNVKQLLYYMAMANKQYGRLLIQYLNQKKVSPWREIDYKQTPEELRALRVDLVSKARTYLKVSALQDPSLAPHIANDKDENYLCKICPYRKECTAMRKKAGETT